MYQYGVHLEGATWDTLPETVRQEVAAMRELWNLLVDAFEQYRAATTLAPPVPAASRSFFMMMKQLAIQSSVAWANKQFILTQFQAAVSRFYKKQNRPPRRKTGSPEEVYFHHRFTSGGLPAERIFGRGQRLHIAPVSLEAFDPLLPQRRRKRLTRTTGSFLAGTTPLTFRLLLHRPLPTNAYVKSTTLIGRQIGRNGYHYVQGDGHPTAALWRWSLHLTLETPPFAASPRETTESSARLNIHCQFVKDERLQLARLIDVDGREEAVELPTVILEEWRYKRALQRKADQLTMETKMRLRENPQQEPLSQAMRGPLARVETMRAPGLFRLWELLEREDYDSHVRDVLRRWAAQFTKLLREMRGLERRYLNHRDWFYRNTVLRLCRRYQRLIITTTLLGGPETSQQLAAPGQFITFLLQAAKKTHTEVQVQSDQHYSSRPGAIKVGGTSNWRTRGNNSALSSVTQSVTI